MTPYAYRAVGPGGQIVRGRLDARDLPDPNAGSPGSVSSCSAAGRPSRCSGPPAEPSPGAN